MRRAGGRGLAGFWDHRFGTNKAVTKGCETSISEEDKKSYWPSPRNWKIMKKLFSVSFVAVRPSPLPARLTLLFEPYQGVAVAQKLLGQRCQRMKFQDLRVFRGFLRVAPRLRRHRKSSTVIHILRGLSSSNHRTSLIASKNFRIGTAHVCFPSKQGDCGLVLPSLHHFFNQLLPGPCCVVVFQPARMTHLQTRPNQGLTILAKKLKTPLLYISVFVLMSTFFT